MTYQQAVLRQNQTARMRRFSGRNRNLQNYKANAQFGPVSTTLFLVVIVGVLSLLYLTQVTKTSVYGYRISELLAQQEELIERQQELRVEAARLQSVARIEKSAITAGLEPESQVSYDGSR